MPIIFENTHSGYLAEYLKASLAPLDLNGELYFKVPYLDLPILQDTYITFASLFLDHALVVFHDMTPYRDLDTQLAQTFTGAVKGAIYSLLLKHPFAFDEGTLSLRIPVWHVFLRVPRSLLNVEPTANTFYLRDEDIGNEGALQRLLLSISSHSSSVNPEVVEKVKAVLLTVTTIKSPLLREGPSNSWAEILSDVSLDIGHRDKYQNKAALTEAQGIQRIRGLAGTGKTAVLALKAFRALVEHPDWVVGITFYSRSLYQHFKTLFSRFAREINKDGEAFMAQGRLRLLHAWGSTSQEGLYSMAAKLLNVQPLTFSQAKSMFGQEAAFEGAVAELLKVAKSQAEKLNLFDLLLIDEAQDLPQPFFELAFYMTKEPKRIVYAYDELQSLTATSVAHPADLFGKSAGDRANAEGLFRGEPGYDDFILKVVYRTNRWVLTTAHALGFGIYRSGGQVQAFEEPTLWVDFGYESVDHALDRSILGKPVTLVRGEESHSPKMNERFPSNENNDVVDFRVFERKEDEFKYIAQSIQQAIQQGLKYEDIGIVVYDPLKAREWYLGLVEVFAEYGIPIYFAGVEDTVDSFVRQGYVAFSHIYRAKGQELPMIVVSGAEEADVDPTIPSTREVVQRRNFLFTAITRAQCWVRIAGTGEKARRIHKEFLELQEKGYRLEFVYPDQNTLKKLRSIQIALKEQERMKKEILQRLEHARQLFVMGRHSEALRVLKEVESLDKGLEKDGE